MANIYTVNTLTSLNIPSDTGLLDAKDTFPPQSNNFLTITPNVGQTIMASGFKIGNVGASMELSLQQVGSQTQWPSIIEWKVKDVSIGSVPFYKIVFQDSQNIANNINFTAGNNNRVFVWIYFGTNETTPITSQVDLDAFIDIDFDLNNALTRLDTLPLTHSDNSTGQINTFTI